MPTSPTPVRRLRTLLLAGLLGAGLIGFAGTAYAQDDPASSETTETSTETTTTETSTETTTETTSETTDVTTTSGGGGTFIEIPIGQMPRIRTASACEGGKGSVEVTLTNPNDTERTWDVDLADGGAAIATKTVTVATGADGTVVFDDVAGGDYDVIVRSGPQRIDSRRVTVDRCGEITEPVDDQLQVFVRCEDGVGIVTIRVFNTEGESRTYTVSIDDLELGAIELGADEYAVVVDEAEAPDGSYAVKVVAEGVDRTETVDVACAPEASPSAPVTTTTPVPQARPAAGDDDLADTGAAVGGVALIALLALVAGGGLLFASRRKRAEH